MRFVTCHLCDPGHVVELSGLPFLNNMLLILLAHKIIIVGIDDREYMCKLNLSVII